MNTIWRTLSETVLIELEQSKDEGRETGAYAEEAGKIFDDFVHGKIREEDAKNLLDKMYNASLTKDYPYNEPDDYDEIIKAAPVFSGAKIREFDGKKLYDKIYGAWLGRCAGCLLGQPVEGWRKSRITGLLKDTKNYPVKFYISSDIDPALRKKYEIEDNRKVYGGSKINWINNISYMPEDDDTNYTILYLKILEEYGRNFSSDNIAESWLSNVPVYHVCTAERVAYKNFINMIAPPLSGSWYNAYREWIGAQIRADFFGYVCPGEPFKAAEYAWRDGRISHVKNGIYGEMFCAAMTAQASVSSDIDEIIRAGTAVIPEKSRLNCGIKQVLEWRKEKINWEEALEKIHLLYNEANGHHWCHTISNAMICAAALLWGEGDFEKTIGISICAGFDTDCNAATTGSITGMMTGAENLPSNWVKPLNDKVKSGIDGFNLTEISELAERTIKFIHREN